ncbi:sigma-70 family RNA polymerase sigma factor [Pseudomonas sp. NFXW11]|uniref:RNA polymerase sigma factor n=1 Tax=Pseudomonas sp. NFXW11 TaxID=2819531 RepID=UPI003CF13EAB
MNCSMQGQRPAVVADQLFEASWKAVLPGLQRRARQLARGNTDGAQEWLAATAIKALLFFRRAPGRIRDPQGFLFLVLDHVFVDSCRRRSREQRLFVDLADVEDDPKQQLESPQISVLEQVELLEALAQISRRVAQLPLQKRRLFELKFVDDLPYPHIAAELGMNQPLARKHVQLLREALR